MSIHVEWLDRQLTKCAYCYALCLTEEAYFAELDKLGVKQGDRQPFSKTAWASATVNFYETSVCKNTDDPVALVCMRGYEDHEPIAVAGLLVHEAVHIWQAHARNIGSLNDHGDEEEAYAIQRISQQLMWSFVEQTNEQLQGAQSLPAGPQEVGAYLPQSNPGTIQDFHETRRAVLASKAT